MLAFVLCAVLGVLGGLTMADLRGDDPEARPRFLPPREQARDFRLTDQDGKKISLADARGDVVVLTWIYATCWDLCPAEAAEIVQAMDLVDDDGVTFYIVSVDPVGDVPKRVRKWLAVRNLLDRPVHYLMGRPRGAGTRVGGLRIVPVNASTRRRRRPPSRPRVPGPGRQGGPRSRIGAVRAPGASGAAAARPGGEPQHARPDVPGPHAACREGEFEHSAYTLLIDRRGVQRLGIPFERLDPATLAQDLEVLLDKPAK